MSNPNDLENRIARIEDRNRRVESDKAWETSWARRLLIAALTYLSVVLFFFIADLPAPWLNSLVPTAAFLLSTATVPFIKKLWLKKH